ncbi:MAG: hypothetical protein LBT43_22350 [Prevotella sp.]|jgi:hypothetical protein|nr:hypothetical protein [Prevotella sp.]
MVKNLIICLLSISIIVLLIPVFKSNTGDLNKEVSTYQNSVESTLSEDINLYLPNGYSSADFESHINNPTLYDKYTWMVTSDKEFYCQLIFGKWKVIDVVPVEINVPSNYSGFDSNDNFRGQDLIDNIVGQEIFFGGDYVKNKGVKYELAEGYKTYSLPLLSDDTIIGCNSAGTLGITGDYCSIVFFTIPHENRNEEGKRDFTSFNQLYLKDLNTIYASINGCFTFELERESPLLPASK